MSKKIFFRLVLFFTFGSFAHAGGAIEYSCTGIDRTNDNQSVVFSVLFSDYAREAGYTNQLVAVTRRGGVELTEPMRLQMYDATGRQCQHDEYGSVYLEQFSWKSRGENRAAPYKVEFKLNCSQALRFDVSGYCNF